MIKLIDSLSYGNKLRTVSPVWKCAFAAVLLMVSYLSHPLTQLTISCWLFVWIVGYARIPARAYIRLISAASLFYAVSLPAIVVEIQRSSELPGSSFSGTILFTLLYWTILVTDNGLHTAVLLLARIAACLSCLLFIILTTPVSELFQVMRKLRMPALVLELMLIMYRFLFVLESTAYDMYTAQRSRGGQSGFTGRLKDTAVLIVHLFSKSMQRYRGLAQGLMTRGFVDEIRLAPLQAAPVPLHYRWESSAGVLLLLMLEIGLRWRDAL